MPHATSPSLSLPGRFGYLTSISLHGSSIDPHYRFVSPCLIRCYLFFPPATTARHFFLRLLLQPDSPPCDPTPCGKEPRFCCFPSPPQFFLVFDYSFVFLFVRLLPPFTSGCCLAFGFFRGFCVCCPLPNGSTTNRCEQILTSGDCLMYCLSPFRVDPIPSALRRSCASPLPLRDRVILFCRSPGTKSAFRHPSDPPHA